MDPRKSADFELKLVTFGNRVNSLKKVRGYRGSTLNYGGSIYEESMNGDFIENRLFLLLKQNFLGETK